MLSRLLLSLHNSSVPALLLGSDQAFLYGDIRALKQQLDNIWIRQVVPLRNRINQLVPRQRHLITSLRNQSIGLGSKRRRKTLSDSIGRTSALYPNRLPKNWLNVFGNATL